MKSTNTARKQSRPAFGTKAETLASLEGQVESARILPQFSFTVQKWNEDPHRVLLDISNLEWGNDPLVVRSSSLSEDTSNESMAGAFLSLLNVRGETELKNSIERVIASFGDSDSQNQVLIQPMLQHVIASGVITTHVLGDGAPYYMANFDDESGETDRVTGGIGVNKTVLMHRDSKKSMFINPMVARWLDLARELESIFEGTPLDIEFAETANKGLFLLQVRPIAAAKNWDTRLFSKLEETHKEVYKQFIQRVRARPGVAGKKNIFGIMPDWNPAEIIGTVPRPLATSLYREIITQSVWRDARRVMGYFDPPDQELLFEFAARPYIDVRNSFNSFLPADLDEKTRGKLVDAWLTRLANNPHWHDKVEFEVATTILDFQFRQTQISRFGELLTPKELDAFENSLRSLTEKALNLSENGSLKDAISQVQSLQKEQLEKKRATDPLSEVPKLLKRCKERGTLPFSVIARHGFIAETLLRSAKTAGAISEERIHEFKNTVETISGEISRDFKKAYNEESFREQFLKSYGHLRPGTYDILSLRYDQRQDLFEACDLPEESKDSSFSLSHEESNALNALFEKAGIKCEAKDFIEYAALAIAWREKAKFIFTRDLSDVLELLAKWGEQNNLSREDVSYLRLENILESSSGSDFSSLIDQAKERDQISKLMRLGFLMSDVRDLYVIPLQRGAPNFVTSKSLKGSVVRLESKGKCSEDLRGKIICIENADPGFDWIFTRGIAGLITKYGGSNSHMAIRCAEFGLPAAIGCGEQTFERIVSAGQVEIDCASSTLIPVFRT